MCFNCMRRKIAQPRNNCLCSKMHRKEQEYFAITQFLGSGKVEGGKETVKEENSH